MATVQLECTFGACEEGPEGTKWKTQSLSESLALQMLDRHLVNHGMQMSSIPNEGSTTKSRFEKLHRPSLSTGTTMKDFKFFLQEWERYKRASGDTDVTRVRDQLLNCTEENLRKQLSSTLGDRILTISEKDLLDEIEILAVEKQSNLVHTVALMSAVQERDEGVRHFVARLRGLAAVCDLTIVTKCSCNLEVKVSAVDSWILLLLVKNLYDSEIRQEVMSKVKVMTLDETIAFVEAKETSLKATQTLDKGVLASGAINNVQKEKSNEAEKCKYCGNKGHGKNPNFDLKKASCPAFNNKCKKCSRKGHYQDFCTRKQPKDSTEKEGEKPKANSVYINSFSIRTNAVTTMKDKSRQNMTSLGHEEWSVEHGSYVETDLPSEPLLSVRVMVDIKAYEKHKPPLYCYVDKQWRDSQVDVYDSWANFDVVADTGAQVCVMGIKHVKKVGLRADLLLKSRMNISCANKSEAGIIGVFYARLQAPHCRTGKSIETRAMIYVIEGDALLLSKKAMRDFGCVSSKFPSAGVHLSKEQVDHAVANLVSEMYKKDAMELVSSSAPVETVLSPDPVSPVLSPAIVSPVLPSAPVKNAITVSEMEIDSEEKIIKPVLRQPEGTCDPESDLPCSCPIRQFVDPPTELPMPATKSNRAALEAWIKEYYKSSAFNLCKRQQWPHLSGPPVKMHTSADAVPVYHRKPTKVPLHFREEVRIGLEADVRKGILERVPPGEADTWCSRLVIQPKKNGKARRTVDLSGLSRASKHESHHSRSAADIAKSIPAGMLKTTLDCVDGYHGVELDPADRHKTTFSTEWGLYRYKRLPQGYLSSSDGYTKHKDAIMEACPDKPPENDRETIIDDTVLFIKDMETSFFRVCKMLSHCNENGIVFNPDKFHFAEEEVEFAGFVITMDGIRPTDKYIETIRNFPTPKCITDVRSWYGFINQVAYSFIKTEHMAPFRHLLSPSTPFVWNDELETSFQKSKEKIVELIRAGVAAFDPNLTTCLSPDYSKDGMGWILQQKTCSCAVIKPTCCKDGWRLVLAGGHFCNKAEKNYSPPEGEAAAVARGLEDSKYYTLGCKDLWVATDHSSLVSILGDQSLADVENPRLARIKERTLWWKFKMVYTPGKKQLAADALSRRRKLPAMLYSARLNDIDEEYLAFQDVSDQLKVLATLSSDKIEVISWDKVYDATVVDPVLVKLAEIIHRGFPQNSYDLGDDVKPYFKFRHDLHILDGVICYKDRIVIPSALQKNVLEVIHGAHQGVSGMVNRVEESVFWPGITTDIIKTRGKCMTCTKNAPSQPSGKPVPPPTPSYPFQYVVLDYFSLQGRNFLIIGDRFSGWLSIYETGEGQFDGKTLVKHFRAWCEVFNIPEEVSSDGGPQMMSTIFQENLKAWDVKHRVSSSYFPHSNCRAELAVKTGKRILKDNIGPDGSIDNNKFMRAIMQFRNTPMQDCRRSPAQIVYGRQLRDFLPTVHNKLRPLKDWSVTQEHKERMMAKRRECDGQRWERNTKEYSTLDIGTPVAIQNQTGKNPTKWDKTGVILENNPHSQVMVRVDGSRRITRRNRKFVKPLFKDAKPRHPTVATEYDSGEIKLEDAVAPSGETTEDTNTTDTVPEITDAVEDNHEMVHSDQSDISTDLSNQPSLPVVDALPPQNNVNDRPRRSAKPNPKYSPEIYDLS